METSEIMLEKERKLNKLDRQLALQKIKQRKTETRHKIELGGLVIKSKMNQYSKAVILGVLLEAFEFIENDDDLKKQYQRKGEAAFMGFNKNDE